MPKKRKIKSTHLVVGEGPAEITMIKAIRDVFGNRSNYKIKYESANGGSPYDIMSYAVKVMNYHQFDKCTVIMDSDINFCKKCQPFIRNPSLTVIQTAPICLEGFLLNLLSVKVPKTWTGAKCKTAIAEKYKAPYNFRDSSYYRPIFEKFRDSKKSNDILDDILEHVFEKLM